MAGLQEMAGGSSPAGVLRHIVREPKRVWVEFPVSGALLDTDVGYILFDTGVALDAWKTHTRNIMEAFPFIRYSEENRIENQLKQIGLRLEDILLLYTLTYTLIMLVRP